jgi:hypothetical protein
MANTIKHPLLHVIWEDHASQDAWTDFDSIDMTPALVHTIGVKIAENPRLLVLAANIRHNTEKCFGLTFIIKSCIRYQQPVRSALTKKKLKSV